LPFADASDDEYTEVGEACPRLLLLRTDAALVLDITLRTRFNINPSTR
jgi:hypothetical protein